MIANPVVASSGGGAEEVTVLHVSASGSAAPYFNVYDVLKDEYVCPGADGMDVACGSMLIVSLPSSYDLSDTPSVQQGSLPASSLLSSSHCWLYVLYKITDTSFFSPEVLIRGNLD